MTLAAILFDLCLFSETAMVIRFLKNIVFVLSCVLGFQSLAQTGELPMTGLRRWEAATIGEHSTELVVRFDRPISHVRSWLFLVHNGKVVETIHPRLEAAPNVLFARIQTPAPGLYSARWVVCPEGSNDRYNGEFSFTIGQAEKYTPAPSRRK
jgi:hypothetical protein